MQEQQPQISFEDTTEVKCANCNSRVFQDTYLLRKVSKFISGLSEDQLQPISVLSCAECKHVLEQALPKELKGKIDETDEKMANNK